MRKILGALLAALMLAASLVAFAGSPAQAACPYTGCIATNTKVNAPGVVMKGHSARITVKVFAAGNASPKGRVTLKVQRRAGGFTFVDSKNYSGGKISFNTGRLWIKGKYIATAIFKKKAGSRWNSSSDTDTFRVNRRHR
jgi:hypothetical protein